MDKKQIVKKYLSLFLALVMIIGIMPLNIFAETYKEMKNGKEVERTTDWSEDEAKRLSSKSENWNLAAKNRIVDTSTVDPLRIPGIDYVGTYINDEGRTVIRIAYTGHHVVTTSVWKKFVIKAPIELEDKIDWLNPKTGMYTGWYGEALHDKYDGNIKQFSDTSPSNVGGWNTHVIDLWDNDNRPSRNSNLNIPMDFVLKDGETLESYKEDLLFQARLYDNEFKRTYSTADVSNQSYNAYTFSTVVPTDGKLQEYQTMDLYNIGEDSSTFGGTTSQIKFNQEEGYIDVFHRQYKGSTLTGIYGEDKRYGLRQSVDEKFYSILKPNADNTIAKVFILGANAKPYSGWTEKGSKEPYGMKASGIIDVKADKLNKINGVGFLQVVNSAWDTSHEYADGVKSVKTDKHVNEAILGTAATGGNAGLYTVVRYYVDSNKIVKAFNNKGLDFFSFYTAIISPNEGMSELTYKNEKDRVLPKGTKVKINLDQEVAYASDGIRLVIGDKDRNIDFYNSIAKDDNKKKNFTWILPMGLTIPAGKEIKIYTTGTNVKSASITFSPTDTIKITDGKENWEPKVLKWSDTQTGGTLVRTFYHPNLDPVFEGDQKITGHSYYEGAKVYIKTPENNATKEQELYAKARDKNSGDEDSVKTEAKDVNGKTYKAFEFTTETPNNGGYIQSEVGEQVKDFVMPKLERDMPISVSNANVLTSSLKSLPYVVGQVQTKVHFDYQWDMNQGKNVVEDKIVPLSKEYKYDPETGKANPNYIPSGFEGENVKYAETKTTEIKGKTYQNILNHDGLEYNINDANEKDEFMKRQFPENPDRTNEGLTLVAWSTKDPNVFAQEYKKTHSAELTGKTDEEQKKIINKALIEELKQNKLDDAYDWADTSKAYSFTKTSPVVKEATVYAVYDTGATIILHANKNDTDTFTYEIKINKNDFVNGKAIIKIPEAYYNQYDEGTFEDSVKPEFKQDKKTFAGWTLTKEDKLLLNGKLEVLNKDVANINKMIENKRFDFTAIKEDGTNYLPNGYSLVLEGTYEDWIKKGNIDLYAQYRDFIDVSVDKRFRTLKEDGTYSKTDDVSTDKKHSAKIGLIYRTAVTDWTHPTVHSAANYSALPKGAYGYAETLQEYKPVRDNASSDQNYLADVSWKLPGFDKYGQRLSYAAVEVPIGEEDNYYNFGNDWSKLGIRTHNNLNTNTGKIEQDPNAPKDPIRPTIPLAKSQDVIFKDDKKKDDDKKVDTFTAATYRRAVKGKTVGPNSEVKAYEITMTNVPINVLKPSIDQAYDGEKSITIKYKDDRVDTMQVTFPGGHEPTNITKKTVAGVDTWTSATVNSQYLKIESNKDDKTLTFTIYPNEANKTLHTDDKVKAQNFIGTLGSEIDEMTVKPKGASNKVTQAEQTHNDDNGNSTIEMEIPNPTTDAPKEGTKYVLVKQNDDGSYPNPEDVANGTVAGVDTKEITPGTAPGAKLTFTIPKENVIDGNKFKIISIEPRKTPDISDLEITIDKKAEINDAKVEDSRFRIFTEIRGQIAEADIPADGKVLITINGTEKEFTTKQGAIEYLNRVGLKDQDKVTFKVVDKYGNEGNASATYNKTKQLNIKVDPVRARKSYIYLQSENGATIKIIVKRGINDLGTTTIQADGSIQKVTLTTGKLQKGDIVVFEGNSKDGATSNPFALIAR